VPILLGGLFRAIGQADVPLFAFPSAKARYVTLEMQRWARWWGAPFDPPRKFPQRTVAAQRLIVLATTERPTAALSLALALGRAMWAEQRDLEDAATLREVLAAVELPEGWADRTGEPEVKAALVATTTGAEAAGVFGVPTFVVRMPGGPATLFWGQDRLDQVAAALAGWRPRAG
jgi:2-hydroxychromene-2-carboxylate isomerase